MIFHENGVDVRYFARSGALVGFAELVHEYGGSPRYLMREAGLSPALLQDMDLYMPYEGLADILTLAAERCEAPQFGAELGWRQGLEAVGALGSLMCMQANLPDALMMLQRNLDFHARGVQVEAELEGGTVALSMRFAFADHTDCRQLSALSMALLVRGIAQLHQGHLPPERVELAVPESGDAAIYEPWLGAPVQLTGRRNRAVYPLDLMELAINPAASVRERLSQQWRHRWTVDEAAALPEQVTRAMTALLPTGECNLETVARLVGLHPRSLQNRLKAQRSSFGQLLEATRLRLALQYLRNTDTDLTTLAMNLGYSELAPFSRAFKVWTGQSPRDWRRDRA
ncbi:MAG: helix-turn-helix domain-containing protein [Pseudomonadota bacterium]